MRIIIFLVLLHEILKEVHSLKCHVNKDASDEDNPVPTDCKTDEICSYSEQEIMNAIVKSRACMPKQNDGTNNTAGTCDKPMNLKIRCFCDADNCNHECTAEKCKKREGKDVPIELLGKEICEANCKAGEGGSGNEDGAKTTGKADGTGQAATGDGTGQAATGDGSQTVAEPNKYAFALWIVTTLVTFLLTY